MFERNRGEMFGNVWAIRYSLLLSVLTALTRKEDLIGRIVGNARKRTETFRETAAELSPFQRQVHHLVKPGPRRIPLQQVSGWMRIG
jgi:hypothetical protein